MFLPRKLLGTNTEEPFNEVWTLPGTTAGWSTTTFGAPSTAQFILDAGGPNLQINVTGDGSGAADGLYGELVIDSTDVTIIPSYPHEFRSNINIDNTGSRVGLLELYSTPNTDGTGTRTSLFSDTNIVADKSVSGTFTTPADHASFVLKFQLTNSFAVVKFIAISCGATQIELNP